MKSDHLGAMLFVVIVFATLVVGATILTLIVTGRVPKPGEPLPLKEIIDGRN